MSNEWEGRVALVTGAASGIGRACAVAFAEAGVAHVVVADVDDAGGFETVRAVDEAGAEGRFVHADVTRADDVTAMVGVCVDEYGGLDAAVNNAGTSGSSANVADYPLDEWQRVVDLNLTGVFLCLRRELTVMAGRGRGAIVNVASAAGLVGFPGLSAYVASKHGVVGLTKSAALEYAAAGVRVNAVCPGTVRTPMLEEYMARAPGIEQMMEQSNPLGRLAAPGEIASAVVWLCSDAASFVLGHAFPVDGGAVVQ